MRRRPRRFARRCVRAASRFPRSERTAGRDAWDQKIRTRSTTAPYSCRSSPNTPRARLDEGYFRLEWKLAVDRSHLMATERLFLVPVVVDGTRDQDAFVPDAFRAVQWTRLPGFQRCGRGCGFSLDACGVETCCGATWRT